ncbi:Gfo/Idh/MocA family protein [Ornithinibacillus halophilus]|uniref:Predicted dehydrogenase n=1 Tax=Ornithinibacillus halophilus TaxID=930117 RepID=A0A1M5KGQ5_9BACI|nr:Gfo/Idh/MocA family oxidoreductase [Ornithinibacillus halophilus]SHG51931.1 Predicted dehydrogenase [Ornithinibacillus halophilus]
MIRVGLVGLGFIGKTHLEAYRHIPNAKVVALCSRSQPQIEFDGDIVSEYEELLKREDIDVVDLCVPTFLHEEMITKAAEAGKHIICEKPLTLTEESAKRIFQVVEDFQVRLFVGHVLRFWPEYKAIKSYCEKMDTPEFIHASRLGQLPNWSNWFQHPEKSGGALFDLHIHDIDFAYYLLGEVERVYAVGQRNQHGAWNHVVTTLTFKKQAKAVIEGSQRMPKSYPFTMTFRAQAGENALDFQLKAGENIETINASQFQLYEGETIKSIDVEETDAFQNELTYFIDCLEKNQENKIIPLEDVLYIIKLLQKINQSLETNTEIKVD